MQPNQIDDFLQGKFHLDCPVVKFTPYVSDGGVESLSGAGYISLNQDGGFDIKVYLQGVEPYKGMFDEFAWEAGKTIPDESYYNVEATDMHGKVWVIQRLIPYKSYSAHGVIVDASFPEMESKEYIDHARASGVSYLDMYFNEVIEVPMNTKTDNLKRIGDVTHLVGGGYRLARFEACEITFEIEQTELGTKLSAKSETVEFTKMVVQKILESFTFVTSHLGDWSVVEVSNGKKEFENRLRVQKRLEGRSMVAPPLHIRKYDIHNNSIWTLFEAYLKHVLHDETFYLHPISMLIKEVIEAGRSSLSLLALVLSVSTETLLRDHLGGFNEKVDIDDDIYNLQMLLRKDKAISSAFKDRLTGFMASMRSPRAKDILDSIANKGYVDKEVVKVYGKLRNKSAHGASSSVVDFQNAFNEVAAIKVLFYQLVFLIISYKGNYTDYGTYGHPTKIFPPNSLVLDV